MREIGSNEVFRLRECLEALAAHHNEVSTHFKGTYPSRPFAKTLALFSTALLEGSSRIAVVEEGPRIAGFCKIDFMDGKGKLDYLIVLEEFRRKGYGRALMDWAMETFRAQHIGQIEVKVVDGNEAIRLYEAYGFRVNAHVLLYKD